MSNVYSVRTLEGEFRREVWKRLHGLSSFEGSSFSSKRRIALDKIRLHAYAKNIYEQVMGRTTGPYAVVLAPYWKSKQPTPLPLEKVANLFCAVGLREEAVTMAKHFERPEVAEAVMNQGEAYSQYQLRYGITKRHGTVK